MSASTSSGQKMASIDCPILTPQQEQEKWLGEAVRAIDENAQRMNSFIYQRDFPQVLRSASEMLAELSTGLLTPQNYYELYVRAFDEMRPLEQFFEEEVQYGRSLEEIYEVVQHTGRIVPRLYLLITAGAVYIKTGGEPVIEILRDLLEMCKGVQHPTRGLFLRHFLLTSMKNKLPGDSSRPVAGTAETDGGTVEDSAELILQNFKEMNWLWIRMEAKGPGRAADASQKQRTQKDRKELCVLVGMNIVRLSQLEGVGRKTYKTAILPEILRIIVKYREPLAQQYLLEIVVQVFPDEFHLFTIEELLGTLDNVSSGVDVCAVLSALMERLGQYALSLRDGITEAGSRKEEKALHNVFDVFLERIDAMVNNSSRKSDPSSSDNRNDTNHKSISLLNSLNANGGREKVSNGSRLSDEHHKRNVFSRDSYIAAMFILVRFALRADKAVHERLSSILLKLVAHFEGTTMRTTVARNLEDMLIFIIEFIKNPNEILQIDGLHELTALMPFSSRRAVAVALCTVSVQSTSHRIASLELAGRFFELIAPIVKDDPHAPAPRDQTNAAGPADAIAEEQHLLCRVLHILQCDDLRTQMKILHGVRRQLGQGGPQRMAVTLPALASLYLRLALRIKKTAAGEKKSESTEADEEKAESACAKALRIVHSGDGKGILEFLTGEIPLQAFYLYLTSANTADTCELSDAAYELYVAAFQIYEENAADTRQQIEMLTCILSSLHSQRNMPEENYELLATKVCQYSSKLVRKFDQCRMVALCAHLFWKNNLSAESHQRVLECLQRSLKIAGHTPSAQQLPLYVDLFNHMLHYYAGKAPGVTVNYVSALIDHVQEASNKDNSNGADDSEGGEQDDTYSVARTFYRNTTRYIRSRKQVDERWEEIDV